MTSDERTTKSDRGRSPSAAAAIAQPRRSGISACCDRGPVAVRRRGTGRSMRHVGIGPSFAVNLSPLLFCLILACGLIASSAQSFGQNADERVRIEQALPAKAVVQPLKPRRLLSFTLNVGYGGQPSIANANEAFTLMGKKTGAFETTVSTDPAVFQRDSLQQSAADCCKLIQSHIAPKEATQA